jgi:hypothetical protein
MALYIMETPSKLSLSESKTAALRVRMAQMENTSPAVRRTQKVPARMRSFLLIILKLLDEYVSYGEYRQFNSGIRARLNY